MCHLERGFSPRDAHSARWHFTMAWCFSIKLAAEAGMSLSSFHKHFKHMTSLTPGQYQQRLRLIDARRLMFDEGFTASNAAFEVGYESVSQFTREYGRLFQASPKRDALHFQKTIKAASRSAAMS